MKRRKAPSPDEIAEIVRQVQLEHKQAKKERDALRKRIDDLTKKIAGKKPLNKKSK
jgi:hypothetical protein